MKVGIVDADLIGKKKHRFPNLASEKISAYYKDMGNEVSLLTDWDSVKEYAESGCKVFVSKVFTETPVPDWIFQSENIKLGGTGFYFDKAPDLPCEIEHHTPDYHLYDNWISDMISSGVPESQFKEYKEMAIGFITRGCFRKCPFCVNQKYDRSFKHSPLSEFVTEESKKICMLDDNFFSHPDWKPMLNELIATGKPFKFKQGLDERLLTDEKCEILFQSRYDGDYIFAFDNVEDYEIIEKKLKMIRRHTNSKSIKFYVLVGFRGTDAEDIKNAFIRIELLGKYGCLPYIMRYRGPDSEPWKRSENAGIYIELARWCNQPTHFKHKTFREFCLENQKYRKGNKECAPVKHMREFEERNPEIASKYFDNHFWVRPVKNLGGRNN